MKYVVLALRVKVENLSAGLTCVQDAQNNKWLSSPLQSVSGAVSMSLSPVLQTVDCAVPMTSGQLSEARDQMSGFVRQSTTALVRDARLCWSCCIELAGCRRQRRYIQTQELRLEDAFGEDVECK